MTSMQMSAGQKKPISEIGAGPSCSIKVEADLSGIDISAFGLDGERKLKDDRYFVFYNQPESPERAIGWKSSGDGAEFQLELSQLPASIERVLIVATHDDRALKQSGRLQVSLGQATFDALSCAGQERALMLMELYRHPAGSSEWRVQAVGQGFNGGLRALLEYFGGEALDEPANPAPAPASPAPIKPPPAATPAPAPAPTRPSGTVCLAKRQTVSLEKLSERPLRVVRMGLGWDPAHGGGQIDLDASCIVYDSNRKDIDKVWFMDKSGKGIRHSGDNLTGRGEGDDEQITIELEKLDSRAQWIVFTINSFSGQAFQNVRNAFCRVVDVDTGKELARFDLGRDGKGQGMFMAKLTRTPSGWDFTALGEPGKGATVRAMINPGRDLL